MRNPINNAVELVREDKLTTCNRCGCSELAWVQLKTSGKWVLCPTSHTRPFYRGENLAPVAPKGYIYAVKVNPHRCDEYREKGSLHQLEMMESYINIGHDKLASLSNILTQALIALPKGETFLAATVARLESIATFVQEREATIPALRERIAPMSYQDAYNAVQEWIETCNYQK